MCNLQLRLSMHVNLAWISLHLDGPEPALKPSLEQIHPLLKNDFYTECTYVLGKEILVIFLDYYINLDLI